MLRLLQGKKLGDAVYPEYDAQWRTMGKAERLGYLDNDQKLTEAGVKWLETHDA